MARSPEAQAKQAEIVDRLERGILELTSSERWAEYLSTAARFHSYSASNIMLILMQRPDATRVAGFRTWQGLGRQVCKGEKGIAILAPCTYGGRTTEDPDTGERVTTERLVHGFRVVYVFDEAQTSGAELPSPVTHLEGDSAAELLHRLGRVASSLGFRVEHPDEFRGPVNGDTSFELKRMSSATSWPAMTRSTIRPSADDASSRPNRSRTSCLLTTGSTLRSTASAIAPTGQTPRPSVRAPA